MSRAVVWFRDDLRVHDNEPLALAAHHHDEVVPLYTFDPRQYAEGMFGLRKKGPHWARFRRESVLDLRESLRELGGDLLVRHGEPEAVVPDVAATFDADAVHCQTKAGTEELTTENTVRAQLAEAEIPLERSWTHTLYHLHDLPDPVDEMQDTYTPWRKSVERGASVRETLATPSSVPTPELDADGTAVPTLEELGVEAHEVDDRAVLPFEGGESAGKARVEAYFWEGDHLREYKQTRNGLLGPDFSSKLSAWLAHGCLSPRYVYEEVKRYEDERVSNEDTYWLVFELLWRDFFQFQFLEHGAEFFHRDGIRGVEKDWRTGPDAREAFETWAAGETGLPFVDANMRELNETGYMSNRGRQNVASFLADLLQVDWRMGAAYFESRLVDYDVASNWGNWAYQAGVGNDSRDNYFYVPGQAERYDGEAAYVKHWLPELEPLPPAYAHHPWRMSEDEQAGYGVQLGLDYPSPMLDIDARYDEMR
ncbi:DASH family cryptochrome [Salinirubellus salinus]|uniref:Cryptochrome DASH n=1 Tax=Salinirubellus salinus TaxID=1364945 RepID=A0A9E7R677_9EURY|nr:DASH family cryptochrome [Salinirubellus salinus]UWM56317.1 DASH family cryptochrome [Salinirubellus salinus]